MYQSKPYPTSMLIPTTVAFCVGVFGWGVFMRTANKPSIKMLLIHHAEMFVFVFVFVPTYIRG